MLTIRDLMNDPALFGSQFAGDTWNAWRALLAGFYGLELTEAELPHWQTLTGRQDAPQAAHDELYLVIGRRGGKSQCAALLAVFEACFRDHTDRLSPGEVATVLCLAADRKQARAVFRYITGLMNANPMLKRLIVRETAETLELSNRAVIEVGTASFRATRGYTFAAVIADEIAFWRSEDTANPDREILNAVRPGLATLNGPLIALSSPYARRGVLWEAYRRYFGKPDSILVAQAPTLTMNPTLPARIVEQALQRDPEAAKSEYLAEFRSDISNFITAEALEAVTRPGLLRIPFREGVTYNGFIDATGGGSDEYTLAIGHREEDRMIIDIVEGRKGVPASITAEYAALLRSYGVSRVHGDRYAGSWVADEFKKHGITLIYSEQPKSGLYIDCLAIINSGQVELPPDQIMLNQFQNLERRTARGGRESIDHPPGAHDDRANAVAGLVAHHKAKSALIFEALVSDNELKPFAGLAW